MYASNVGSLPRWQDEAIRVGDKIDRILVAFEAGYDGFWLARWRRAKIDHLETGLLPRAVLVAGSVASQSTTTYWLAIPNLAEEGARRPSREREMLVRDCEPNEGDIGFGSASVCDGIGSVSAQMEVPAISRIAVRRPAVLGKASRKAIGNNRQNAPHAMDVIISLNFSVRELEEMQAIQREFRHDLARHRARRRPHLVG
jgi:hypothetical protein